MGDPFALNDHELAAIAQVRLAEYADLIGELGHMLWCIEGNYNRETAGPGSRFEGQRLEICQAWALLRRLRDGPWVARPLPLSKNEECPR